MKKHTPSFDFVRFFEALSAQDEYKKPPLPIILSGGPKPSERRFESVVEGGQISPETKKPPHCEGFLLDLNPFRRT